jgi:hypothetical protein
MVQKYKIANFIFFLALLYIASPWVFEKKFYFNELLSATGILIFIYKRMPIVNTRIYLCVFFLIVWGMFHGIISLFRMDSLYYYLRNSVIVYSMFCFFLGFFSFKYLGDFVTRIRQFLRLYIGIFLFMPISQFLFERYGMATLFPTLIRKGKNKLILPFLIVINLVYSITYKSSTSFVLAFFLSLILISPGYKFFRQVIVLSSVMFFIFFVVMIPNLNLIKYNFSFYNEEAIRAVMASNEVLGLDPNNTWRLVLWNQFLIDLFPSNIFGIGFGTPAVYYYPVADFTKLDTLPYVLGAHNSFIYLFSRLGIIYLLLTLAVYTVVFKEYFYHKTYYKDTNEVLLFYSFFALTIISAFNPTLETPIFAAGYWMVLGFTARSIYNRQLLVKAP